MRRLNRTLRQLRTVWFSIVGFSVAAAVVLLVLDFPGSPKMILLYALAAVGFMDAVMSVVLPRQLLRKTVARMDRGRPASVDELVGAYHTYAMLAMALRTSVFLMGVPVAILGFPKLYALSLFGVSWGLQLLAFPREASAAELVGDRIREPEQR